MRPSFKLSSRARGANRGVALIIVLAFVVLLTAVVVAFFSRAMSERQISSASSGQVKVDMLAEGAMNNILGDLKEEISAGSVVTTGSVAGSGTTYTYCVPAFQWAAVPCASGTIAGANWLPPNVLKRSAYNQPFYTGTSYTGTNNFVSTAISGTTVTSSTSTVVYTPSNRAAQLSSTTPALNGRYVSLERWNKALLIPTLSGTSTQPQLSGTMADGTNWAYAAPDWVLVDRSGNNPTPVAGPVPGPLQWSATGSTTVVGRYAYTIYDEGGLLDMNVAGHPTSVSSTTASVKSTLAMADLTQIGLNQSDISAIVTNWRNQATAQESGNFRDNMLQVSETNGFLGVNPVAPGDNAFTSRQSLINFILQGISQNTSDQSRLQGALQYMGTFSRTLQQPSFSPNPNRPMVTGTSSPPTSDLADTYLGNNDAVGHDQLLNPSFLSIRVTGTFKRLDGTIAQIGEPLVKHRFALSRLGLVSYSATATQTTAYPGDQIYDRFGIYRSDPSAPWTYNHGASHIMTLREVAAANREPDFAEMLKAAIVAGSLAKGGPNLHPNGNVLPDYEYTIDTAVDYNILQIMVDLIDQYHTDSYPTVVQISVPGAGYYRSFAGIKDLPYFYRYQPFAIMTVQPSPLLSKADAVSFPVGTPGYTGTAGSFLFQDIRSTANGGLTNPGQAVMMYVPEIWNPHDANEASHISNSNRPTQFRITAQTDDPVGISQPWQIGMRDDYRNYGTSGANIIPSTLYPQSVPAALTATSAYLQFSDHLGALFREPTLVWQANNPVGISLSGGVSVTDFNTNISYVGIVTGTVPVSGTAAVSGTTYIVQGDQIEPTQTIPASSGGVPQITFTLQYLNAYGKWVTYDQKYPDMHGLNAPSLYASEADYPNNQWENPMVGSFGDSATAYDPRTARFGVGTSPSHSSSWTLEVNSSNNTSVGAANFSLIETERPRSDSGDYARYSNPCMTSDPGKNQQMLWFSGVGYSASGGSADANSPLFYDGLMSQNNWGITLLAKDNATMAHLAYEDPDGICRRAMGAYAATSLSATASTIGLPLVTVGSTFVNGRATSITSQSQSRPIVLNRPFRSVAEMSYAFRGTAWRNIDFFTPESGDSALLDVFCVNEPTSNPLIAGVANLNSRQPSVLAAILSGAYCDEYTNVPVGPAYSLPVLSGSEAQAVAQKQVSRTLNSAGWRGPLANVSELVGRYVGGDLGVSGSDQYTFNEPISGNSYTYTGLSCVLDSSVYANTSAPLIQRFRETAIRPLADCGQTRVWNLMIDVIAQSGRYPQGTGNLTKFQVEGEKRYWVHVAVDRFTGQVVDKQVEVVTE